MTKEWDLGEEEAPFQKGATAHAEEQPLLEEKSRQGLQVSKRRKEVSSERCMWMTE